MPSLFQSPYTVLMIRPHFFNPNPETSADNVYQQEAELSAKEMHESAFNEVNRAVKKLRDVGVTVHLFDDKTKHTPDSVFPNNWFTTHGDGCIALYPMYCRNRRKEINGQIINFLANEYDVNNLFNYSSYVEQGLYLEGTGAMVFDHKHRIAYAVRSKRMSDAMLQKFCHDFGYTKQVFDAADENNIAVYHTNVLMSIGDDFAMISLEMIRNSKERNNVRQNLLDSGKEVIELSTAQIAQFAGNTFELRGSEGNILALSTTAYNALTLNQIARLERYVTLLPIDVPTIELAGGSVRCMLAGIHLKNR